uniref:Uncharacterized protein n=1 Tax=Anopheles atroparvus TaxID=41427 RepID=A0A182JMT4_ANOAO
MSSSVSSDCCEVSCSAFDIVVTGVLLLMLLNVSAVVEGVVTGRDVVGRTGLAIVSEAGLGLALGGTRAAATSLLLAGPPGLFAFPPVPFRLPPAPGPDGGWCGCCLHQRLAGFAQLAQAVAHVVGAEQARNKLLHALVGHRLRERLRIGGQLAERPVDRDLYLARLARLVQGEVERAARV